MQAKYFFAQFAEQLFYLTADDDVVIVIIVFEHTYLLLRLWKT